MILRKFRMYFDLSLLGFCLSAASLFGIPLITFEKDQLATVASVAVAVIFWSSLTVGIVFLTKSNKTRIFMENKQTKKNSKSIEKKHYGIITFFSNKKAKIIDIVFLFFFSAVAVLTIAGVQFEWLFIFCFIGLYLSLVFHSFLNGKNYIYIVEYKKYLKQKERQNNE